MVSYKPKPSFFRSVSALLRRTRMHFREINFDKSLTEADKKRLKEFYLEHLVTPRAKEIMRKFFPAESDAPDAKAGSPPDTGAS